MATTGSVLAVFASLNQVALLKRILYRRGIYVEMLRTPQCLVTTGCSFGLRCAMSDLDALNDACAETHIKPGGVFKECQKQDGVQYQPCTTQDSRE